MKTSKRKTKIKYTLLNDYNKMKLVKKQNINQRNNSLINKKENITVINYQNPLSIINNDQNKEKYNVLNSINEIQDTKEISNCKLNNYQYYQIFTQNPKIKKKCRKSLKYTSYKKREELNYMSRNEKNYNINNEIPTNNVDEIKEIAIDNNYINNKSNIGVFNNFYYNNYLLNSFSNNKNSNERYKSVIKSKVGINHIYPKYSNKSFTEFIEEEERHKKEPVRYITNFSSDKSKIINKEKTKNPKNDSKIIGTRNAEITTKWNQVKSSKNIKEFKNIRNFIAHLEILIELFLKRKFEFFIREITENISNTKRKNINNYKNNKVTFLQKFKSPTFFGNKQTNEIEVKNNNIYIPKKIIKNDINNKKDLRTSFNILAKDNTINRINTPIRELNIKFNKKGAVKSSQLTPKKMNNEECNLYKYKNNSIKNIFYHKKIDIDEGIYKKKLSSEKKDIYIRNNKNAYVARNNIIKFHQKSNYDFKEDEDNQINNDINISNKINNNLLLRTINLNQSRNKIKNIIIKTKIKKQNKNITPFDSLIIKNISTSDNKIFIYIKYVYLYDFHYKKNFNMCNLSICSDINLFIVNNKIFMTLNKIGSNQLYLSAANIKTNIQNENIYYFDNDDKKSNSINNKDKNKLPIKKISQKIKTQHLKNNLCYSGKASNNYLPINNNKKETLIINRIYYNNNFKDIIDNKHKSYDNQKNILFFKKLEKIFKILYINAFFKKINNNKIKKLSNSIKLIKKIFLRIFFILFQTKIKINKKKKGITYKNIKFNKITPIKKEMNLSQKEIKSNIYIEKKVNNNSSFEEKDAPICNINKNLLNCLVYKVSNCKNILNKGKTRNSKHRYNSFNKSDSIYKDRNRNCKSIQIKVNKIFKEDNENEYSFLKMSKITKI